MPPKRRTAAKSAPAPPKPAAPPPQPKQTPTPAVKQAAPPPPPPPPPPPVESPSAKVRKEWLNFISTWYEPEKKKLVDQLTKELDAKYKKSSSRIQQNARHAEMEKRLSEITTHLAEPAHEEWNSRLAAVQLRVDDWTDITQEEQQSVIDVFNAFYEDNEEEDSTTFHSNELDESVALAVEEPQLGDSSPFFATRQSPPTPITANFELVNPSSFFTDTISPAKQARKLPELAMDNLATLNNLNTGRTPADHGQSSAVFGFQGWASEAGLPIPQTASQSQSTNRNRATDNISRQTSAASSASPPLFSSHSPPQPTTKISPLSATHTLLPGKRYIGPVIAEEEAEPIDEELRKAKMAADFLEFKMEVRIQMIQQFHAKASAIEIELARQLESNNSTCSRESRLLTLHEHEENMLSLRESKELERKKLCDQERDRRLQEHRILQQATAQKAMNQTRFNASASSSKIPPATQAGWSTHPAPKLASQKENLSTGSLPTKPDPPSILKKSASAHIMPSFDAAAFLRDQAEAASLANGKQPASAIASSRPSALKKTESISSQDEPAEPPAPPTAKGKKGKKTPGVTQQPKTVTFNEEPDADAEPPPVWGAKSAKASVSSKSVMIEEEPDEDADPLFSAWASKTARATTPAPAAKKGKAAVVEEVVAEPAPPVISPPSWGSASGWGSAAAGKKGKGLVVPTEPMEDPFQTWAVPGKKGKAQAATIPAEPTEDPYQSWTAPAKKAKAKAPTVPAEPTEDPYQSWTAPVKKGKAQAPIVPAEPVEDPYQTWTAPGGAWATKKTKVTVTEEPEEEAEMAWGVLKGVMSSSSKQAKKVVPQPETQPEARRGAQSSSKSALVQDVGEEEEEEEEEGEEEEEWDQIQSASAISDATGDAESDGWGSSYWSNLAKGQPISQAAEESAPHMLWTPSMDAEESGDEDSGEGMESALWMQYAISGGELAGFEAPEPQENVHTHVHTHAHAHAHVPVKSTPAPSHKKPANDPVTSIWEQGKGKKKSAPAIETKIETTRTSSARTAQWPKAKMEMENWASRLGQSSGSARHL